MSGAQKLPDDQAGECLGDFTDVPTGPLSSLWTSTRHEVVSYTPGDPGGRDLVAHQRTENVTSYAGADD